MEITNKGILDKNNEKDDLIEFVTNHYLITINLNYTKGTISFNACKEEIGNIYYSKEYELEELFNFFQTDDILNIFKAISDSVFSNAIRLIEGPNKLSLEMQDKNITIPLEMLERSKEEIENLLIDKLNFLIREKNNYKNGWEEKKLYEDQNEEKLVTRINSLESQVEALENNFKLFKEVNLLSCSNILNIQDWEMINEQLKKLGPEYSNIYFKLVYKATRDGDSSKNFHQKCDKIGPNITLVKTIDNHKFGGFTKYNWEHLKINIDENQPEIGSAKVDKDAFCFSIDLQKIYPNYEKQKPAIFCCNSYGPTFCRNIFAINDNMFSKGGYCMKKENSYYYGQTVDYEISGGKKVFGIKDVEVLEIVFMNN